VSAALKSVRVSVQWSDRGWRLNEVLDEHLSSRPPRSRAGDEVAIAWRGYLGGEFMADDYGGAVLRARRAVEQDPELRSFVEGPTRLVAHTCMASTCASADVGHVSVAEAGPGAVNFNWQPIGYGRSKLRYHLTLPSSGVVVESELFSEGWRARIGDGDWFKPIEINGGLRGWLLPAGDYELELGFSTPLLEVGLVLSGLAVLAYGLAVAIVRRVAI